MAEKQSHLAPSQPQAGNDLTLGQKGDLTHILSADGLEKPVLRGFDARFSDIVDYIVKITHEIWEERAIGRLYDYYGTNIRVHTSDGEIFSRDKVMEVTIQALAAFPNRRLYAEEVIWGGNDDDGYFSSHRLRHEGTNWGHTAYGPPTGRRVSYRAIADCAIVAGVIVEEWLVRDRLHLIKQLGFDALKLACQLAQKDADAGHPYPVPSEADRLRGQLPPRSVAPFDSAEFDPEAFVRRSIHEIWNWRLLNKVKQYYATSYLCEAPSARRLYGHNQYVAYVLSLLAAFPDLAVAVDHFCALQSAENTYRTATRWTMRGTHTGPGIYGQPTGKQIRIMGISHHILQNAQFIQEWTLFDEFALLKQLSAPD